MDYLCLYIPISLIVFVVLYLHKTIKLRDVRDKASLLERIREDSICELDKLQRRLLKITGSEYGSIEGFQTKSESDDKRINSLQKKVKDLEKEKLGMQRMLDLEVTLDELVREMNKRGYFVEISRGADFNESR
jgi:uncharacterized protein HemX